MSPQRILYLVALALFGAVLLYGGSTLPGQGDPQAPASVRVSPTYIWTGQGAVEVDPPRTTIPSAVYPLGTYRDARTPNAVTTMIADYRGFDTLGETAVIFTAGIACFLLLRSGRGSGRTDGAAS